MSGIIVYWSLSALFPWVSAYQCWVMMDHSCAYRIANSYRRVFILSFCSYSQAQTLHWVLVVLQCVMTGVLQHLCLELTIKKHHSIHCKGNCVKLGQHRFLLHGVCDTEYEAIPQSGQAWLDITDVKSADPVLFVHEKGQYQFLGHLLHAVCDTEPEAVPGSGQAQLDSAGVSQLHHGRVCGLLGEPGGC